MNNLITESKFLETVYIAFILVIVAAIVKDVAAEEQKRQSTQTKMLIGMIAGFCFIVGLSGLIITVWCCFCGNGCSKNGSTTQVTPAMELITQRVVPTPD